MQALPAVENAFDLSVFWEKNQAPNIAVSRRQANA